MVCMSDRSPIVIGVAGRIGSGKSVVAHCLEREFGFQYLRYSLVLAEWLHADPADKSHLQEIGGNVMAGEGQSELNSLLINQIDRTRDVAVDGLRHPTDHASLATKFGKRFFLIFVETLSTSGLNEAVKDSTRARVFWLLIRIQLSQTSTCCARSQRFRFPAPCWVKN